MKFIKTIKKNKLLIISILAYIFMFFFKKDIFFSSLAFVKSFFIEMIQILPLIAILSGLINIWIPEKTIKKFLGKKSGTKGIIISFLTGGLSAGPIYAAFPFCNTLIRKGASISNIVIILSSWAVIKLPMFLVETSFLGIKFSILRYILTIPSILLMSFLIPIFIKKNDLKTNISDKDLTKYDLILEKLPGFNCKSCGYKDCKEFAKAVNNKEKEITDCPML